MEIVIHRVNTLDKLESVPVQFGCEIDIRAAGSHLVLHHEPFKKGIRLSDFLEKYRHGLLILNVKEAGIENEILDMVRKASVKNFFLLDVEFPYLYKASRQGVREIAVRFSEDEPIELVQNYQGLVDWVWIDTITQFPVELDQVPILHTFKSCIVCPERWGRAYDISLIRRQIHQFGFKPTAVMTSLENISKWIQ